MAAFQYRAVDAAGKLSAGLVEGRSADDARTRLRRQGLRPIETVPASGASAPQVAAGKVSQPIVTKALGELAVLVGAGLALDRALTITIENVAHPPTRALFERLLKMVREGASLARAIVAAGPAFPRVAAPMVEAGEASGRLAAALAKLADTLERSEALRTTIVSASIYPLMLLGIAAAVIVMMLVGVIPQFEGLFGDNLDRLPATTRAVLALSRGTREHGLSLLLGVVVGGAALRLWSKRPAVARALDRRLLRMPGIGPLVTRIETARFARVLGSLVEGGVGLPAALALAQATLTNTHMASAVGRVVIGLKQGAGLTVQLAATGLFPSLALSFMRTGEETARLGQMLDRLADVLEQEARVRIARLIAIATPAITVLMGVIIASLIASIMSAILGFNDLAIDQ